ncbi:HTH-type transcriptional repressor CytR [compost metagenome]
MTPLRLHTYVRLDIAGGKVKSLFGLAYDAWQRIGTHWGNNMTVTSRDVALLAGVSQPTVSRALRDDSRVSDITKERVRQAALQLGYVPSDAGRALSSGRTKRIGLLLTDLENHFYPHIIGPAYAELEAQGYQLMLHTEATDSFGVSDRLISNGLDGVILATTTVDSVVPLRLRDRGLPFVYLNRTSSGVAADSAVVDPSQGMVEVADELHKLGHRRVATIFGPTNTSTAVSRELALRDALAHHGISIPSKYVARGPFNTTAGHDGALKLLSLAEPPTAIICGNDVVAFGALNAARSFGADVPGDVSIVGFDNLPTAEWPIIRLTTISYDLAAMVRESVNLLIQRIGGPKEPFAESVFPSELIRRDTLGKAS